MQHFSGPGESDRELPTSPLSRRRASPARANTPPARQSPKKASKKRTRGMPDPSSPVTGDPNRGTSVSTKSREPKPAKAARENRTTSSRDSTDWGYLYWSSYEQQQAEEAQATLRPTTTEAR